MILLIGPNGGVDFGRTSFYFRTNIEDLLQYLVRDSMELMDFDFGIGDEPAFRCCECHRFIPLITGSVDHVIPRTRLMQNVHYITRGQGEVYESVKYTRGMICIHKKGKVYLISPSNGSIGVYDYQLVTNNEGEDIMQVEGLEIPLKKALENDMHNLQLMCHYCNSRKGNRGF